MFDKAPLSGARSSAFNSHWGRRIANEFNMLGRLIRHDPNRCQTSWVAAGGPPGIERPRAEAASRADLLKDGGIYPVVVPLGWKIVGPSGEHEDIPAIPGHPFHRILGRGALLAVEAVRSDQPELMVLRQYGLRVPVTSAMLGRYADSVLHALSLKTLRPRVDEQRIGICALSSQPAGKVVVSRLAPGDGRMDIRYLVRDLKGQPWELTYLVRQSDIDRWRPLLEEIEGPTFTSPLA